LAGSKGDDEDAAMRARLAALSKDLASGNGSAAGRRDPAQDRSTGSALNLGVRVASEFVGAIVVGTFIGWEIDRWLHSSPAALIVFIGLGTAAAFYNVYRIATKTGGR
jgi:ATP synthase protein I